MREAQYSVTLYSSPLPLPLSFAVHTYLVVETNDVTKRLDVDGYLPHTHTRHYGGYIFINLLPPTQGYKIFGLTPKFGIGPRWQVTKHGTCSGTNYSPAHNLHQFVETDGLKNYPFINNYNMLLGPNSNTFTQWIIDQVPECSFKLPNNAWGKNYKKSRIR